MHLEFIKNLSCPSCGCTTIIKEEREIDTFRVKPRIRMHSNGQCWEKRQFLCGTSISHIPNYSSSTATIRCGKESSETKLRREKLLERTLNYVKKYICPEDEVFGDKLTRKLKDNKYLLVEQTVSDYKTLKL